MSVGIEVGVAAEDAIEGGVMIAVVVVIVVEGYVVVRVALNG